MKNYKTRFVLLFALIAFVSVHCSIKDKKVETYFLEPVKNQLRVVIGDENKNNPKIYYNGKDYTSYVKEFLDLKPFAFVSDRILILSEEGVRFLDGEWKCNECIIIYPRKTELVIIEATDISYNDVTYSLKCSNAIIKMKRIGKEKK